MPTARNPLSFGTAKDAFYKGVKKSLNTRKPKGYRVTETIGYGRSAVQVARSKNGFVSYGVPDAQTGKVVWTKGYRGKQAREIKLVIDEQRALTPRQFRDTPTGTLHAVQRGLKAVEDPTMESLATLAEGRGLLRACYNHLKLDPNQTIAEGSATLLSDFAKELAEAMRNGDVKKVRELVDQFNAWKSNEELDSFYDYEGDYLEDETATA